MISLNYRDSRPIYEQIQEGLKRLIVTGALGADEKLPSVRTLATQLSINPNTIQRAYNELETEGYIYSVPGKGSFASGTVDMGERRRRELTDKLCALAAELIFLGVSEETLLDLIRSVPVRAGVPNAPDGETPDAPDGGTSDGETPNASDEETPNASDEETPDGETPDGKERENREEETT